ncbi:MAG TPA: zinc ribbon domain-containing protein [Anaerolineae bacterium]|nr:zinc ribbon domain-containing protein [Anaerolineae bacterium]
MGIFDKPKVQCPHCKAMIEAESVFCKICGKQVGASKGTCQCGARINAGDKFCRICGQPVAGSEPPALQGHSWARRPSDFAARLDVDDVPGFFRRSVVVEPGTNAILIQAGRSLGTVPPGEYTLDTLTGRLGLSKERPITAILVDVGDTILEFALGDVFTADPLRIAVDCETVLQLQAPVLFLTNLMRNRRNYTLDDLRGFLAGEVDNAVREYVRTRKILELNSSVQAKRDLELDVEAHLNRTLQETGLRLVQVRTLNYRSVNMDALRQTTEEYYLEISSREAKLQGKKLLLETLKEEDLLALAEETQKILVYERRAALFERMRQAVLSDKMKEVRSEEDLENWLAGVDRERLLRADEMERFKRDLREHKEDYDLVRANLAARMKAEQEFETLQIQLRLKKDYDAAKLESDLAFERQRIEGVMGLEVQRQRLLFDQSRQQAEFAREQTRLDEILAREQRLQDEQQRNQLLIQQAQTQADVAAIERQQLSLEEEMGIVLLEKMKAMQRRDDEERKRIDLDAKARELEQYIRKMEAEFELRLREEKQKQDHDLARLQMLGTLSAEALIAASAPDQARILAELKGTEALKGMSEDQILAVAAQKSPQVAAAFVEKFRGNPQQQAELIKIYEEMLAQQKESSAGKDALHREMMAQQMAMFKQALDSQKEIAVAYAHQSPQGTTVVMPGTAGPQVLSAGGMVSGMGLKVVLCKNCGHEAQPLERFCSQCGAKLA